MIKKSPYLAGMLIMSTALAASAQTSLYTTTDDFALFNGGAGTTSSSYYSLNNTVNGIGNTSNPGGTGGVGSLQLASIIGWGDITGGSFTAPTYAAFQALSPGSSRPYSAESSYGAGTMLPASGTITMDVYLGNLVGYSYYQFGVNLNYDNNFGAFFATSSSSFTGADGNTWTHLVIPYTTQATSLTYFGWGVMENSGGTGVGGETIYVDNIQIQAAPEPGTMALAAIGCGAALLFLRRRSVR